MSKLRSIHNLQTIGIFSSPFEGAGSFIKRAEDLVLGSIIMVMISSLMLAIAIGIKLTSRGPVFFKQDRYGLCGQKLRSGSFVLCASWRIPIRLFRPRKTIRG